MKRKEWLEQRRLFWSNHIGNWQKSGLSQAGYCRGEGLDRNRFCYWRKRLSPDRVQGPSLVSLPLPLGSLGFDPKPFVVEISAKYRIEVPGGFDPDSFRNLVEVLAGL